MSHASKKLGSVTGCRSRGCWLAGALLFLMSVSATAAESLETHTAGIWAIEPIAGLDRWLVIHNLEESLASGIYHIEVLARPTGEPAWRVDRIAPHMAISAEALQRSIVSPRDKGAVYPESFNDAFRAWQAENSGEGGQICTTSVQECL